MKIETYHFFSCPSCRGRLLLEKPIYVHQHIESGILVCVLCNHKYPIINYIPRFSLNENYTKSFGFQWNKQRKTQLDRFTGYNFSRERLFSVSRLLKKMKGEKILEVGSGAGRFTQILAETEAEIFSFDYSEAVDVNLENNGCRDNLHLFQGDLHHIPLAYELFDKVICLGVLQHTPNPEQAFMSLVPFIKTGGELVIDIYKKTILSMLQWKYILRPITKKIDKQRLYQNVEKIVPILLPVAIFFRKIAGPVGSRILPIANYSHLQIPYELNKQWSILDTFDMYSPTYDKPQTIHEVRKWFIEAGFKDVDVRYGANGIVGKARKPGTVCMAGE